MTSRYPYGESATCRPASLASRAGGGEFDHSDRLSLSLAAEQISRHPADSFMP
jgi:hypothetical protein